MKAGAQLQKRGHPAVNRQRAAAWHTHTGNQFKQRGFAGAVFADNSHGFALCDRKTDVRKSGHKTFFRIAPCRFAAGFFGINFRNMFGLDHRCRAPFFALL